MNNLRVWTPEHLFHSIFFRINFHAFKDQSRVRRLARMHLTVVNDQKVLQRPEHADEVVNVDVLLNALPELDRFQTALLSHRLIVVLQEVIVHVDHIVHVAEVVVQREHDALRRAIDLVEDAPEEELIHVEPRAREFAVRVHIVDVDLGPDLRDVEDLVLLIELALQLPIDEDREILIGVVRQRRDVFGRAPELVRQDLLFAREELRRRDLVHVGNVILRCHVLLEVVLPLDEWK